jgi:hypothetical protein
LCHLCRATAHRLPRNASHQVPALHRLIFAGSWSFAQAIFVPACLRIGPFPTMTIIERLTKVTPVYYACPKMVSDQKRRALFRFQRVFE